MVLPPATLAWRLQLLKEGAAAVNPTLAKVRGRQGQRWRWRWSQCTGAAGHGGFLTGSPKKLHAGTGHRPFEITVASSAALTCRGDLPC